MKIGIISINLYTKWLNLACPLHSYAMQQFLTGNGYDCKVIDYKASYYDNYNMRHPSDFYKEKYKFRLKRFPADEKKRADWFKAVALTCELEKSYRALYEERASRYDKFKSFIDTRLNVTEKGYSSASMEFEDPGFDCYMCVTDVIWKNEPSLERAFFLANRCMDNKIKIAYSASRGSSYTKPGAQRNQFFRYLEDFNAISVREPSLKEHIDECSDIESTVVLDPVMLHGKDFYSEIAKEPEEKGYMFLYHVVQAAEDTIEQAVKYAKAHNLTIIESSDRPYPEGKLTGYEGVEHKWIYDIGIEEWLGYIKNAKCVFTNSFHCCCLSIIFGKNFFAGSRNGDKVDNVLSIFGLENRRFDISTDILGNEPGDIDYEKVHAILAEKRAESGNWLLAALKKAEENPRPVKDYDTARMNAKYHILCNFNTPDSKLSVRERAEASPEYRTKISATNNEKTVFTATPPRLEGYRFVGWAMRTKIDGEYYRFTSDGGFAPWESVDEKDYMLFTSGSKIPHIPANGVINVIADAVWKKPDLASEALSDTPTENNSIICNYNIPDSTLTVKQRAEASPECIIATTDINTGEAVFKAIKPQLLGHRFVGWAMRARIGDEYYRFTKDGGLAPWESVDEKDYRIFASECIIPSVPSGDALSITADAVWKKNVPTFAISFNSTLKKKEAECTVNSSEGKLSVTRSGFLEYKLNSFFENGADFTVPECLYTPIGDEKLFKGWQMRFWLDMQWYWYLEDGSIAPVSDISKDERKKIRLFLPGEKLPKLPEGAISNVVFCAYWHSFEFALAYHSGTLKAEDCVCSFDEALGTAKVTDKGAFEYLLNEKISNNGTQLFADNSFTVEPEVAEFTGWYLRVKDKKTWKWYLEDGSLAAMSRYSVNSDIKRRIFNPGEIIEDLNLPSKAELVAVATWKFPAKYPIAYHSGTLKAEDCICDFDEALGTAKVTDKGAFEYLLNDPVLNDGSCKLSENKFTVSTDVAEFTGWYLRVKDKNTWKWYLEDDSLVAMSRYSVKSDIKRRIFNPGEIIEVLNLPSKAELVAVATWKFPAKYPLAYHSGTLKAEDCICDFDETLGTAKVTDKGAFEYLLNNTVLNNGSYRLSENKFTVSPDVAEFTGWYLRVKDKNTWKWYLENGSLAAMSKYSAEADKPRRVFAADESIDKLNLPSKAELVAVATWKLPKIITVPLAYHSGTLKAESAECRFDESLGTVKVTAKGAYEYQLNAQIPVNKPLTFSKNSFIPEDESIQFNGWYLRVKLDGIWSWYLEDGSLADMSTYSAESNGQRRVFHEEETAEDLTVPEKSSLIAVATWKKLKAETE